MMEIWKIWKSWLVRIETFNKTVPKWFGFIVTKISITKHPIIARLKLHLWHTFLDQSGLWTNMTLTIDPKKPRLMELLERPDRRDHLAVQDCWDTTHSGPFHGVPLQILETGGLLPQPCQLLHNQTRPNSVWHNPILSSHLLIIFIKF